MPGTPRDTTPTASSRAPTTWPDIVGTIAPKYGDPSWYFSFLLLGVVATIGLVKYVEVKFGGDKKKSRPEPPTETFPVRKPAPVPVGCDEHARRIKDLEDELSNVYDTFNTRLIEQERAIRETVTSGLKTAREEQDRRTSELREDLKGDMERLEDRIAGTVADKLSSFQSGLLAQIQTMFLESKDGVRISGPFQHPKQ